MKQRRIRETLAALFLLAAMLLLCACPTNGGGGGTTCEHTYVDGVCTLCGEIQACVHTYANGVCTKCGAEQNCAHNYANGVCTLCGHADPTYEVVYGEGAMIEGAGDSIAEGAAVLTPVTYDASTATELASAIFFRQAKFGNGAVSAVKDGAAVTLGGTNATNKIYENAVLIFPAGVTVEGASKLTFKNVVIVGDVSISGSKNVLFEGCQITGAVTISKNTGDVVFKGCRLTGADTLLTTAATNVALLDCYVEANGTAVVDSGAGLYVKGCRFAGAGIATKGEDATVQYSSFTLAETATGIAVGENAVNFLAAMNVIRGTQKSVTVDGARNAVVVRNTLISLDAKGNRNLYVCDNEMGGRIKAEDNNYFLADGNAFPEDGKGHASVSVNNTNVNGDSLMDVDARLEVGADENLLPHVDKDQFLLFDRKTTVRDPERETEMSIYMHILEAVKTETQIFIAPGAYETNDRLYISGAKNKTIYAYGVYVEYPRISGKNNLGTHLALQNTENITVKGLQLGYAEPASGQVHVLEKMGGNRVLVIASAGMINEFASTNLNYYEKGSAYWHRLSEGQDYVYRDVTPSNVTKQKDGTMTMTLPADVYDLVGAGDIFTCRAASGASTVSTNTTKNTLFMDMVVYGSSGGLCFVETTNASACHYYRVADTSRSGEVIDEATYEKYAALEAEYAVDLGIYVDEEGNYRGEPAHISSIDATHVIRCAQGSQITSCFFENMCDDGTNQKGNHGRLAEIKIEGDVATIIYKGNLSETKVARKDALTATGFCSNFAVGDRICIYTSAGQLICDTAVLSATVSIGKFPANDPIVEGDVEYRQVTVPASAISEKALQALEAYDLTDDNYKPDNKVLVDNMSRSSNGFNIDNTMIKNTRSRGLLIKSSDGTVTNCTFRNNAKCGVAIIYEIYWGESGMSENLKVERNLFDNTSYSTANQTRYQHAPLIIMGLGGGTVSEDFLLYKNIDIIGNKFINRNVHVNPYAIYLQAVRDVVIEGNDFGTFEGESEDNFAGAIGFNGAMNIKIENNTYSEYVALEQNFFGGFYKNVYGTDVEGVIPQNKED